MRKSFYLTNPRSNAARGFVDCFGKVRSGFSHFGFVKRSTWVEKCGELVPLANLLLEVVSEVVRDQ